MFSGHRRHAAHINSQQYDSQTKTSQHGAFGGGGGDKVSLLALKLLTIDGC